MKTLSVIVLLFLIGLFAVGALAVGIRDTFTAALAIALVTIITFTAYKFGVDDSYDV